jgi:hypothetical protein
MGAGKTEDYVVYIDKQRIAEQPEKVKTGQKLLEITQADPLAFKNAKYWLVIFKCNQDTADWRVTENKIPA